MIPRYAREEMASIFTERAKFSRWLEIELLAVEARVRLGEVSVEDLSEIKSRAAFDEERIAEIEAIRHHDVVAFVENVRENVGPAGRHVHFGLTSSDVVDTANALALRDAGDLLVEGIGRLTRAVVDRAREHRHTLMAGRTHGVHAEPTTFGLKAAVWYVEAGRNLDRLRRAREAVAVGKLSGAVGNFAHVDPDVEEEVCRALGLTPEPVSTQVVQRDRHAEFCALLAVVAASLEKIALEVRGLQRTEVLEAQEPFAEGQKGSSAMPHKRNPELSERICGLARVLRGHVQAALENVALWHERDISHSSVERIVLPDATILLDYLLDLTTFVVEGLEVDPGRMAENLDRSYGLVYSQRVLLRLTEAGLPRQVAYDLVQRHALRAWRERRPFLELLAADPEVTDRLGPEELKACFDPTWYTRHVDAIFRRAGLT